MRRNRFWLAGLVALLVAGCVLPHTDEQKVKLSKESLTLVVGTRGQLSASAAIPSLVSWTSNNPSVVSVLPDGSLQAGDVGVARITATDGSSTAQCTVTVTTLFAGTVWDDPLNTDGSNEWPGYWMGTSFHAVQPAGV